MFFFALTFSKHLQGASGNWTLDSLLYKKEIELKNAFLPF